MDVKKFITCRLQHDKNKNAMQGTVDTLRDSNLSKLAEQEKGQTTLTLQGNERFALSLDNKAGSASSDDPKNFKPFVITGTPTTATNKEVKFYLRGWHGTIADVIDPKDRLMREQAIEAYKAKNTGAPDNPSLPKSPYLSAKSDEIGTTYFMILNYEKRGNFYKEHKALLDKEESGTLTNEEKTLLHEAKIKQSDSHIRHETSKEANSEWQERYAFDIDGDSYTDFYVEVPADKKTK